MPFHALGLKPPLTDTLRAHGFEMPTPIQEQAIPAILEGRDVVGSAETGSGKTAAFLLPSLDKLIAGEKPEGTRVLVLVPTRELATQVHTVATELCDGTDLQSMPIYGGIVVDGQAAAMRGGVDIAIATPGRLLDLIGRGVTKFGKLEVLVLDEADRMLDMGFIADIRRILAVLPKEKQTLFFSATMPPEVEELAEDILDDPLRIQVGPKRTSAVPVGITHAIFPVPERRKTDLLKVLLRRGGMHAAIVFCKTKRGAEQLGKELSRSRILCAVIHGDRNQQDRERELSAFMDGYVDVLVATDVAARGIDIEGISHVINYDFPHSPEDYLHRVGRTARAEATGDAFTMVTPADERDVKTIERKMGMSIPRVTLPEFNYEGGSSRGAPRGGSRGGPKGRSRGGSSGGRGAAKSGGDKPAGKSGGSRGRRRRGGRKPSGGGSGGSTS
ncbi:MAG: DEAD/DEAH box helicase [Planctomycetota bacterium]